MRVVGTAGHVDHGKSTLVKALTGTDPDRLKEEKKRQMTIDLGFAWLSLPGGDQVGMIDVPGHRDFIENMLAGVGGIDAVLLVIAADEGVMPQTREHLAIIDLLKIKTGIIVLNKIDLVQDLEWLDLVEADIRKEVFGTVLEDAPIVRVSSRTNSGIDELKITINAILTNSPARTRNGKARLPVDRVFTISGFGTIATGTLENGSFQVGEGIIIQPAGIEARIRGLQTHNNKEQIASPGSRVAMNLSGIDVDQVKRGDVITRAGEYDPTGRIDARIEMIANSKMILQHNDNVKVFLRSSEVIGRIRLLGVPVLNPGEKGWVQIEMTEKLITTRGDRFILRRMSPAETIGGGMVVNPFPKYRYRLQDAKVIEKINVMLRDDPEDNFYLFVEKLGFTKMTDIPAHIASDTILDSLASSGKLVILIEDDQETRVFLTKEFWEKISKRSLELLDGFHKANPLRVGIPLDEHRQKLNVKDVEYRACLMKWTSDGVISILERKIALTGHKVVYSQNQLKRLDVFFQGLEKDPYNTMSVDESKTFLNQDVYDSLIDQGKILQVSPDVLFLPKNIQVMQKYVIEKCQQGNLLTITKFRDHFSTSRKYALAFLEYLDRQGVTIREQDGRRLKD